MHSNMKLCNMEIVRYTDDMEFDYGGLNVSSVQALDEQVIELGWKAALSLLLESERTAVIEHTIENIENESRTGWKYLLALESGASGIDYGCGWGAVVPSLAKSVRHVTGVDADWKRLRILQGKLEADGIKNVRLVQAGGALPLPFPSASVDFISINGVLEWLPVQLAGNPRWAQLSFLKECRRILRENGQLYLGIENRYGYGYFAGAVDEHSGLRATNLMPRILANLYSKWRRNKPYRTYTHSFGQLRELLSAAGFVSQRFYWPSPSYNEPRDIVSMAAAGRYWASGGGSTKGRRLLKSTLAASGIFPWIAPCHAVIASVGEARDNFVERLASEQRVLLKPVLKRLKLTAAGSAVAFLASDNEEEPSVVVKLPVAERAYHLIRREAEALRNVASASAAKSYIPRLLGTGEFEGHPYLIEAYIQGVDGETLCRRQLGHNAICDAILGFVSELQGSRDRQAEWTSAMVAQWVGWYEQGAPLPEHASVTAAERAAFELLSSRMAGRLAAYTVSHGDLHLGNVIFAEASAAVVGVVDWAHGNDLALPIDDCLFLAFARRLQCNAMDSAQAIESLLRGEFVASERAFLASKMPREEWRPSLVNEAILGLVLRELSKQRLSAGTRSAKVPSLLLNALAVATEVVRAS